MIGNTSAAAAIEREGWKKVYEFGEQQARKLGIREGDKDSIIHKRRAEERQKERGR